MAVTIHSMKSLIGVFLPKKSDALGVIAQIVDFAKRTRSEGIHALEKDISEINAQFFAKALEVAVDGHEPKQLIETMETELTTFEEVEDSAIKFYEAAG
jgi:chemotaxis protein MotA